MKLVKLISVFNLCKSSRLGPGFVVRGAWLICSSLAMCCTVFSSWCRRAGRKLVLADILNQVDPPEQSARVCLSWKLLSMPGASRIPETVAGR